MDCMSTVSGVADCSSDAVRTKDNPARREANVDSDAVLRRLVRRAIDGLGVDT
jgi:hypothetical protein